MFFSSSLRYVQFRELVCSSSQSPKLDVGVRSGAVVARVEAVLNEILDDDGSECTRIARVRRTVSAEEPESRE